MALAKGVANEAALNTLRTEALNALDAVAVSLDRRTLTQEMIGAAWQAVAAVLEQLQS